MTVAFQIAFLTFATLTGCSNPDPSNDKGLTVSNASLKKEVSVSKKHFKGALSNGMKGDSISFDISADGKRLENLTFKGYWRCNGRLESTRVGPDGFYQIVNNKVNDHISEPPDGGSTAWRFDLQASIAGNSASGTFRMNINNLGCDTYKLNWTAKAVTLK